jgi:transcriptional regulator with XRE-family HTH domain
MEHESLDLLAFDVGNRLKQLRQERGLSLRAVARLSGLSTNALSMIERSRTSPSVSTLYKISEALGIPITSFFRFELPRQEIVFRKAIQNKHLVFPLGKWIGLGGEEYLGHIEPFLLVLDPGGCSGDTALIHTGHEFVYCLEGLLEYVIDEKRFLLEVGDSLLFSGQKKHRWCNSGDVKTKAMVILSGFEQGESPGEFHVAARIKESTPDENNKGG